MTTNEHINLDEERIDALDHLLFRELGRQDAWRQQMQQWDARQRQQRRLRLLPVISNIASVAALFILGLFLQAALPTTNVSASLVPPAETTEQNAGPATGSDSMKESLVTDSLPQTDASNPQ